MLFFLAFLFEKVALIKFDAYFLLVLKGDLLGCVVDLNLILFGFFLVSLVKNIE